ncbi:hypothetical protein E2320_003650, partial [Naja naja]
MGLSPVPLLPIALLPSGTRGIFSSSVPPPFSFPPSPPINLFFGVPELFAGSRAGGGELWGVSRRRKSSHPAPLPLVKRHYCAVIT